MSVCVTPSCFMAVQMATTFNFKHVQLVSSNVVSLSYSTMLTGFVHGTLHEEWTNTGHRVVEICWIGQRNLIDEMQRVIFFGASGLFYMVKGIDKRSVTIMMPIGCSLLLTSKAWPASATCRATWMLSPQRSAILPMSLMQSVFSWWGNSEFWKCAEKIRANHQSKL